MFSKKFLSSHPSDSSFSGLSRSASLINHLNDGIVDSETSWVDILGHERTALWTVFTPFDNLFNTVVAEGMAAREDHGELVLAIVVLQTDSTVHLN